MFDITATDLYAVYSQLKDKYDLTLTNSLLLDPDFSADCPVILGSAGGYTLLLYEDQGLFVMDILDEAKENIAHLHPADTEYAANHIINFMEGTMEFPLSPFPKL